MIDEGLLKEISESNLPEHIAVIMDGNGRWAKKRNMPRTFGHAEGTKTVEKIVDFAVELGINVLSLYAFSTENWKRPEEEVSNIIKLIEFYIDNKVKKMMQKGVVLRISGDISVYSEELQKKIIAVEEKTKYNGGLILNIAINYGARSELEYAVKQIVKELEAKMLSIEDINYDEIANRFYTRGLPDVDLLIRPSGEQRLSNFLLMQSAYAELWFSDILWPDFSENDLMRAIQSFQQRDRRFGGING